MLIGRGGEGGKGVCYVFVIEDKCVIFLKSLDERESREKGFALFCLFYFALHSLLCIALFCFVSCFDDRPVSPSGQRAIRKSGFMNASLTTLLK